MSQDAEDVVATVAESQSIKEAEQPYAELQATIRAIATASDTLGAAAGLRAELIVLNQVLDRVGTTLSSLKSTADAAPETNPEADSTEAAIMAQALRAIHDVRELRALNREERKARDVLARKERKDRELAEAQQLRAVEDFRSLYRQARSLAKKLDEAYLETISALAKAVDARDHLTGDHVERVRSMSVRLGRILKLSPDALRQLEFGAVLHDVGKIGLPDAILGKPGALTQAELAIMREHPLIGRRMLEGVSFLAPALPAVEGHHERWDGTGYPHGLAGEQIPLAGRIVAVVDAFDAMTSDRPYRLARPIETARAALIAGRGTQFDPTVVDTFLDDRAFLAATTPNS
jgi:HD-GYP domain-containing protein (c-di-GMP phosphodiesterase class II)